MPLIQVDGFSVLSTFHITDSGSDTGKWNLKNKTRSFSFYTFDANFALVRFNCALDQSESQAPASENLGQSRLARGEFPFQ